MAFSIISFMENMNKLSLSLAVATLSILITVVLYDPVSVWIFKLVEPNFTCPIKSDSGKINIRNDSHGEGEFGAKRRNGRLHAGIDIEAPVGSPVYAARSGMAFCGNVPTGYGKYVMIYHPDGYQSLYGHLSGWGISPVKKVNKGDIIGFVGKTGNAASRDMLPHLHFEIRKGGEAQDPNGLMK